jgi:hypothetical protein
VVAEKFESAKVLRQGMSGLPALQPLPNLLLKKALLRKRADLSVLGDAFRQVQVKLFHFSCNVSGSKGTLSLLFRLYSPASTARATRKAVPSLKCAASTCMPTGNPAFVVPHGTVTPQIPARLAVTV